MQLHRPQRSPSNPSPVLPSIPAKQDIVPVLMHIQSCFKLLTQLKVKSGFCFLPLKIVFCQIRVQASYKDCTKLQNMFKAALNVLPRSQEKSRNRASFHLMLQWDSRRPELTIGLGQTPKNCSTTNSTSQFSFTAFTPL